PSDRETFSTVWRPIIDALHRDVESQDWCLTLRDFHSPNLLQLAPETQAQSDSMHLPGSPAPHSQIGLIDFQDAVNGPPAYDLVSLLQDARVDVPERLAEELLEAYIAGRGQAAPDDPFAQPDYLRRMVAFCGAQRATKILGIFARLHVRDGKSGYLVHLPRVRRDLEKNLQHPDLSEVANWFHRAFPA
ncbi:MAG: phosphotransferase, partial [Pseudomonadota bacterium]